jgi:tRNA (mo5U34)-methyltransferase
MSAQTHLQQQIDHCLSTLPQSPTDSRINIQYLKKQLDIKATTFKNPNIDRFYKTLCNIKEEKNIIKAIDYASKAIHIHTKQSPNIEKHLQSLIPWRKGPFKLNNTYIDTEWQSHLKWDRFKQVMNHIPNKRILDIGCGNGYYMFKMLEHTPKQVIGIDPSDLCYFQFHAMQHYIQSKILHYLPIGWGDLEPFKHYFDTTLCMGIMYHHKSPIELLNTIKAITKPKGALLFDTLIIDGDEDIALFPKDRYACMRNVYFLPTINCLTNMLKRAGFKDINILSVDVTTTEEQRVTPWTFNKSLSDFLDPTDNTKTIEGYPAPKRVALCATC